MAAERPVLVPSQILQLSAEGADRLFGELEESVPRRPAYVDLGERPGTSAVVFGDTHGDWRSTEEVVARFERAGPSAVLLGLGDYVDRPPRDLPGGSAVNALYLLQLAARFPERVYLLQGNHETTRKIRAAPTSIRRELDQLWGASPARGDRLFSLLERGPVAATSRSGAYFAHAGFPRGDLPVPWSRSLDSLDEERLLELVWSECDASHIRRGAIEPWDRPALERFLAASDARALWRGHDPDVAGRPLYDGRAMTLHTTRVFAQFGGVLAAIVPLDGRLTGVGDAQLVRLPGAPTPIG